MKTISSRIIGVDDVYVEIETTETRDEFPDPFISVVNIEHHGDPEGTAKGFHDLISTTQNKVKSKQELLTEWKTNILANIKAASKTPNAKKQKGVFKEWKAMLSRCYNPDDPEYEGEPFK